VARFVVSLFRKKIFQFYSFALRRSIFRGCWWWLVLVVAGAGGGWCWWLVLVVYYDDIWRIIPILRCV
jgi:hypothetical protein